MMIRLKEESAWFTRDPYRIGRASKIQDCRGSEERNAYSSSYLNRQMMASAASLHCTRISRVHDASRRALRQQLEYLTDRFVFTNGEDMIPDGSSQLGSIWNIPLLGAT